MPFNSQSYRRNKALRLAFVELEKARDVKRRAALNDAYDWEVARIPTFVKLARLHWRIYLSHLRIDAMKADADKVGQREMTYEEFNAKWSTPKRKPWTTPTYRRIEPPADTFKPEDEA